MPLPLLPCTGSGRGDARTGAGGSCTRRDTASEGPPVRRHLPIRGSGARSAVCGTGCGHEVPCDQVTCDPETVEDLGDCMENHSGLVHTHSSGGSAGQLSHVASPWSRVPHQQRRRGHGRRLLPRPRGHAPPPGAGRDSGDGVCPTTQVPSLHASPLHHLHPRHGSVGGERDRGGPVLTLLSPPVRQHVQQRLQPTGPPRPHP
mmetsp:Transcript_4227/g.8546  ORF Transcript_4227/g.8546 Transcript_4227/m.8546 type:complete len:203 (+) Transcript_4227:391-999(+)